MIKIDKIISSKASKLEFINDYIQILKGKYNKNNLYLTKYYNDNNNQKSKELTELIYIQLDIARKINIGKALKNDIISLQE